MSFLVRAVMSDLRLDCISLFSTCISTSLRIIKCIDLLMLLYYLITAFLAYLQILRVHIRPIYEGYCQWSPFLSLNNVLINCLKNIILRLYRAWSLVVSKQSIIVTLVSWSYSPLTHLLRYPIPIFRGLVLSCSPNVFYHRPCT